MPGLLFFPPFLFLFLPLLPGIRCQGQSQRTDSGSLHSSSGWSEPPAPEETSVAYYTERYLQLHRMKMHNAHHFAMHKNILKFRVFSTHLTKEHYLTCRGKIILNVMNILHSPKDCFSPQKLICIGKKNSKWSHRRSVIQNCTPL